MTKPTNPKELLSTTKPPLELVPGTLTVFASIALAEGASKYGAFNWRVAGAKASVYKGAAQRHLEKWYAGEEADPETGVPHLAAAVASLAILLDAGAMGMLTDDRPYEGAFLTPLMDNYRGVLETISNNEREIKPKHWMINDDPNASPL